MKIRTKKEFNLPEMIQYIMDNEELRGLYYSLKPQRGGVEISKSGDVLVEDVYADDTFTVEVEEELTEETKFRNLMEVTEENYFEEHIEKTLKEAIRKNTSALYIIKGGAFHLIWSRESGIPESGVLEVDNDENQD